MQKKQKTITLGHSGMVDTHTPEYKEAKQKETNKGNTINVQIIKDFHNYKSTRDN